MGEKTVLEERAKARWDTEDRDLGLEGNSRRGGRAVGRPRLLLSGPGAGESREEGRGYPRAVVRPAGLWHKASLKQFTSRSLRPGFGLQNVSYLGWM